MTTKCLKHIENKIPNKAYSLLAQNIEKANEKSLKELLSLNFKCPKTALFCSVFLGILGVDRLYKGDIKLGVVKFLLGFLFYIVVFSTLNHSAFGAYELSGSAIFSFSVAFLILLAACIWWIVDIFFVCAGVKKDNLSLLNATLNTAKA